MRVNRLVRLTLFHKIVDMIPFTRQLKFWLLITLIHVGVIYAFSRARTVDFVQNLVTATVVTSEVPASVQGVQSPSEQADATDTRTTAGQKALMRSAFNSNEKSSSKPAVSDDGLKNTAQTPTPSASASTPNNALDGASKNNDSTQNTFTAPTHLGGHLHNPKPPYPQLSRDAEEEGVVTVSAMVEPNGRPSSVDVVKSSGYGRLDRSAHDTVLNEYRFTPATQGGQPIRYRYRFDIRFNLKKN